MPQVEKALGVNILTHKTVPRTPSWISNRASCKSFVVPGRHTCNANLFLTGRLLVKRYQSVSFENRHGQRSFPILLMYKLSFVYWLLLLTIPIPLNLLFATLRPFETISIGEEATLHLLLPLTESHLRICKPSLWRKVL